jgi:hypothetical protein
VRQAQPSQTILDSITAVFYNPQVFKKSNFAQMRRHHWLILILLITFSWVGCSLLQETTLTINWTTESELDIIGFNLYRADSAEGDFVKINDELIPPAADPFIGGEHAFVDEEVTRGQTYYYQLETVDRNGNTTRSEIIELKAGG